MNLEPNSNLNPVPPPGGPYRPRTASPVIPQKPPAQPILQPDYAVPPPPGRNKRFAGWSSVVSTIALLILAPLIAISIAAFVVQSYQVDGQSMETTLQNNDRLIVDKWPRTWARITHHSYLPERGNIIIFNQAGLDFGGTGDKQLIKRVIGLPVERVVVKGGKIAVYNNEHPDGFNPDTAGIYKINETNTPGDIDVTLGTNEIFVCGDNRTNSEDSRYFGPVKLDKIVGKLAFRVVPLSKAQRF